MPGTTTISGQLIEATGELRDAVQRLAFGPPVTHVYNPLDYAWEMNRTYLDRYGSSRKKVLFLGMNPGPHGMLQTGIPFGEVVAVRDWLALDEEIRQPVRMHPKLPVEGLNHPRSEISGKRLWGLFAERFGTPDAFFEDHFVVNYCPLAFLQQGKKDEGYSNLTPDKLTASERKPLMEICDRHLARVLEILDPEWAIGIGGFATQCLQRIANNNARVATILHPSPASPAANRGWAEAATGQLHALGAWS